MPPLEGLSPAAGVEGTRRQSQTIDHTYSHVRGMNIQREGLKNLHTTSGIMAKIKNPGFLSDDERSYLRSIESRMDPNLHLTNPSRAKARIIEFQGGLYKAIESFVEDARLMQFAGKFHDPEEAIHQFKREEIASELDRCIVANRIGALKFFFLFNPLCYLLIVCLDALTKYSDDQREAIVQVTRLCLKCADVVQEKAKEHPRLVKRLSRRKELLQFLDVPIQAVRDDLARVDEEVSWLVQHPREKEAFLVIGLEEEGENKGSAWVHRDRISMILQIPKKKATWLLSTLVRKDLVEREDHRYRLSEKGEIAFMALAIDPKSGILFSLQKP